MSRASNNNSLDAQMSQGKVRSSAKNNAQQVAKTKKPLLYTNPSWRDELDLNQDDEVKAVDDTAGAPPTPQRKLPASVYDTEGPESTGPMSRDARQSAAVQKRRQGYRDDDLPDPYATRIMPGQMTQKQIDARNAGDSKFARDAQGNRKQSMAQALVNPPDDQMVTQVDQPRDDGSEFEDNFAYDAGDMSGVRKDTTAGAAVAPFSGPYSSDVDNNFMQDNPQPAGDTSGVKKDSSLKFQGYSDEPIPQTSFYPDSTVGDGDDIDPASMLTRNDKIASSSVRPEPGTGAKSFAKQLGYSSFAAFLRANEKNVNKAANGNWVVHPNKDYIPAK